MSNQSMRPTFIAELTQLFGTPGFVFIVFIVAVLLMR
jgi:hypothetical protein